MSAFRFTVLGLSVAFRIDGPKVSAVLTIVSLTIFRGIAHRAVFVALSFVRSSRRQEQLTTLLPGLASSGLTSNRHSLLVRVDEVQGYQGGQVVPAHIQSRLVQVTPIVIAASECRWRKAYQLPLGSVLDWRPRLCTSLTKASQ